MRIKIRRGLDVPIAGAPNQSIADAGTAERVGLVTGDYHGLRPRLLVAVGDVVRLGQPLLEDKARPGVRFVSPGAGEVVAIHRGERRSLEAIVIRLEGDGEQSFTAHDRGALASLDRAEVQELLLESGLWPSLRARPYGGLASPGTSPHSIFVTAIDTNPLAADPRVIISEREDAFSDGVVVLSRLTDGAVHVCRGPGSALELPDIDGVREAVFEGPHPAGLPGTHMHFLDPVGARRTVWHLSYQDAIAIGALFTTGHLDVQRVVALGGPVVRKPRLLRTRLGASTEDLLEDELDALPCRVISGSILSGRRAAGQARYLGPYDLQISALHEDRSRHFLNWVTPGFRQYSAIRAYAAGLLPTSRTFPLTTSQKGSPRAMVPIGSFEGVMPLDVLPVPLLKALIVRDLETAEALGCLELVEEDLALCSFVCCSKYEYGPHLRATLDLLERGT